MALEFSFEGVPQVQSELKRLAERALPIAGQALFIEAEAIMAVSKQRTPVDTGVLRASGAVLAPNMARDQVEVKMGFGGPAEAYAIVQHERLDYKHTVGEAKFLERPLLDAARGMAERLAKAFGAWR